MQKKKKTKNQIKSAANYERAIDRGVCVHCRKRPRLPDRSRCPECAEENRKDAARRYRERTGRSPRAKLKQGRPRKDPMEVLEHSVRNKVRCSLSHHGAKEIMGKLNQLRRLSKKARSES